MFAIFLRVVATLALGVVAQKARPAWLEAELKPLGWTQRARLLLGLLRDKRVPAITRGLVALPVLYLISPIDLLPDFLPGLGRLDDALVFNLAVALIRLTPATLLREHLNRLQR